VITGSGDSNNTKKEAISKNKAGGAIKGRKRTGENKETGRLEEAGREVRGVGVNHRGSAGEQEKRECYYRLRRGKGRGWKRGEKRG